MAGEGHTAMDDVITRPKTLRLHPNDKLAIALADLAPGEPLGEGGLTASEPIATGHKVATAAIRAGAPVRKFDQLIGFAVEDISPGRHVHVHNVAFVPAERPDGIGGERRRFEPIAAPATFDGIVRSDGRVATRNYIGVITTVNCSATAARMVAEQARRTGVLDGFANVDGIVALSHQSGCGMAAEGEAMEQLRRTIGGYARHPNIAGVLIVGLGCEANQVDRLVEAEGLPLGDGVETLVIQEAGGTRATVQAGIDRIAAMAERANAVTRQPVPAGHLVLGLQCGGSDAFSAITANPALGAASDLLVRHGGTAILSETTEIHGAEHLLLGRAASDGVARKLLDLIAWWEDYTARNGQTINNNPSPGNKAGGLTTILEKSLGAVAKGGTADLVDVYRYAEPVTAKGFVFMDTPGYDPVSVTGQVAGGANIVCFTTGRGSCYGCKPAPSLKLATNTALYRRMTDDMDINCGEILDGSASVAEMGERIFRAILDTASGRPTKSELLGYGDDEFAPWVLGATV